MSKDHNVEEPHVFFGLFSDLTNEVIGIFYDVYNTLGSGFLEKVYENAMALALRKAGYHVVQQQAIKVYFEGEVVGNFYADIIVNRKIILEIKIGEAITEAHMQQVTNYLRATDAQVGLILLFGSKPDFKRRIYSNTNKKHRPTTQPEYPRKSA